MRNLLFFVASTIVVLASCSPSSQTPLTNDEREAINEAIVERMNSYVAAIETLDPNVVDDFYVKGPDFRVISDGQLMLRESLLTGISAMRDDSQRFEGIWDSISVTPLGRDVALADARFRRIITDGAGREARDWGTVTWVWVRDNGKWRLVHGQAVHFPEVENDEDIIRETFDLIIAAAESGDADAYMSMVTEDYVYLGPGQPLISGRENVRGWLKPLFADWKVAFPIYRSDEIIVRGDLAVHRYSAVATFQPADGGNIFSEDRKYLDVWQREPDGRWLLARHIYNLNN